MIDWDSVLLCPVHGVFGEPVTYMPARGMPFPIEGIFDKAFFASDALGDGTPMSTAHPVLGVRLALFPSGAPPVQGDKLKILSSGVIYKVKEVRPDSHGEAKLLLTSASN